MNESLEQTIKRLEFCRDCIDQFYEAGQKEYNRLECIIEELKHNCPNKPINKNMQKERPR